MYHTLPKQLTFYEWEADQLLAFPKFQQTLIKEKKQD